MNQIITICFSIGALLVSLTTLYFTFFRKKLSLIGCLAAYNSPFDDEPMSGNYEFCLSNTGNRELLVREAMVDYVDAPEHYLSPMINTAELPAVLKSNQMLLVKVRLPHLFMKNAARKGYKILVRFCVYSPEGKFYMVSKELEPLSQELDINPEGWKPFKMGKPLKVGKSES